MSQTESIEAFLDGEGFAVVGASSNREKYGNKVLRSYLQNNMSAYPVNPREDEIEGLKVYRSLSEIPHKVHGVSFITPPAITKGGFGGVLSVISPT